MAAAAVRSRNQRLPPEVTRCPAVKRRCTSVDTELAGEARLVCTSHRRDALQAMLTGFTLWICRILYVRNLPFNISADEMYDIFGKFGAVRQIRLCASSMSVLASKQVSVTSFGV